MPSERILICGAGVAGSILAFWLAKHNFQVVVIERSRAEQKAGQGIEIEEPALEVVKQMGILEKLYAIRTVETGFELLDQQNRSWAILDQVGGFSPTGALELMRGDLTEVLYDAADEFPNVTYYFETTIESLRQTQDKVIVDLEHRKTKATMTEEFDLVVGADGARSRTRQLVMGSPEKLNCYKPVGAFIAYFTIPKEYHDVPYSRLCHFPNRRCIWTRPIGKDSTTTSAYLIHINDDVPALRRANTAGDRQKQKEAFADLFDGAGWETPRVIESMMKADNFYSDELVQVKLQKWSQDRVVLVGDAAWAPTPFTGQGNQLAIIGAWVLAQELSRNPSTVAYGNYEKRLREHVERLQNLPLKGYGPKLFVPQTAWGIWLFRTFFWLAAWAVRLYTRTGVEKIFPDRGEKIEYPFDLEVDGVTAKAER